MDTLPEPRTKSAFLDHKFQAQAGLSLSRQKRQFDMSLEVF